MFVFLYLFSMFFFFFNDTATTEIYTLSLHDALPISHDLVNFLVAGAVRVVCQGFHRAPVVVQIVRPAHFFGLGSLFDSPGPRLFGAIAHVDSVVAVMSQEALNGVMAALPAGRALQL